MKNIVFSSSIQIQPEFYPEPAKKNIPEWYKKMESYVGGIKKPQGEGTTTATMKKCIPVFDAISSGYIIKTPADVFVSQKDGAPYYEWPTLGMIAFHPVEQAPAHPAGNGFPYPKWINPWSVRTPKGYSALFVQPFHRESIFTILPGVVDTDNYYAPVNFPFVLNNPKFEGLIPAGTPMAQVIPFKRESWKMQLSFDEQSASITQRLRTKIFDAYKNYFWEKKHYE